MEVLPHRDPMLLVDGVRRLEPGKSIDAWFTPGAEREIFQGHFPGNPILPGVYSVESMAQAAGIMVMTTERYRGKLSLFLGIDKVSFRRIVRPGVAFVGEDNTVTRFADRDSRAKAQEDSGTQKAFHGRLNSGAGTDAADGFFQAANQAAQAATSRSSSRR